MILEYLLRVRWLQDSISILVVVRTFFFTLFPDFPKKAEIAPDW